MTAITIKDIKQEFVNFLRNSDIFTITQRGVTTDNDTGTFAADSTYTIDKTNVKNIRSVEVASVVLTYGADYTVDFDFLDTTVKCKITFTSAQTGAYDIEYDYGTDKIYPDFPKPNLKISSFPRIATDVIIVNTVDAGFDVLGSDIDVTTLVYDFKTEDVSEYIDAIRAAVITNRKDFYYLGLYVKPFAVGPILKAPNEMGRDKLWQQNIDVRGRFKYEKP